MANKNAHIKAKALELRTTSNMTLDEIAECLSMPRTTIYYWIKDIAIPTTKKQTEAQQRRADAHRERHAQKRKEAYDEGMAEAPELFKDPLFRDFVVMYIGEGTKKVRSTVGLANSDPKVILLAYRQMQRFTEHHFDFGIQVHVDQDIDELKQFWAEVLHIEPERITIKRKSNSGQLFGRKWRSKYGVMTVRTYDTYFRAKLEAWMDFVKKEWE